MGELRSVRNARQALDLSKQAIQRMADESDVQLPLEHITRVAAMGKFSTVLADLKNGQVYKLQQLGYSVDWNGTGTFASVSWEETSMW